MKAEEFNEMSVEEAKARVEKHGLKILIKKSGEFYHDFFSYGLWRPDFKAKLSILVEHGLDLNQPICERWKEKSTPIFQVLSSSGREVALAINALAEFGADINLPDKDGQTPIMVASTGRYQGDLSKPSIVKALIKAGADLSLKDKKGNLVTDLADQKSLPALVTAGAPVKVESKHALMTAVCSKDLNLTQDLLRRGLTKKLQDWELQRHLPFLETIARTSPDLFQKGFSLEGSDQHSAGKKAIRAFKELMAICSAHPSDDCEVSDNQDALPPSLREGAWPPLKVEPTANISVQIPAALAPEFRFPADILEKFQERWNVTDAASEAHNLSKLMTALDECLNEIESFDWESAASKFDFETDFYPYWQISGAGRIVKCINMIRKYSSSSKNFSKFSLDDLDKFDKDSNSKEFKSFIKSKKYDNNFDIFIESDFFRERHFRVFYKQSSMRSGPEFEEFIFKLIKFDYFLSDIVELEFLYKYAELSNDYLNHFYNELIKKYKYIRKIDDYFYLCHVQVGPHASELLLRLSKEEDFMALRCLSYLDSPSLAAFMSDILRVHNKTKFALAWFKRFEVSGLQGLLECAFCSNPNERSNAQAALRLLARRGALQQVIDYARMFGDEAQAVAVEFLGQDAKADFLPQKMPKLPTYFVASAHPAPVLSSTGEALPTHAIETLASMLQVSNCYLQTQALQDVISACDKKSLADFALSVFEVWSRNGSKKDGIGFLYALAYLGDDRAAAMLSKAYRNAPPSAVAPVLDVLACMASNTAIAGLQAIARSSQKEESRALAVQVLEDVARDRGLTPDMLEDLAVPDLGLDQDSRISLDFGPRHFLVSLDANLDAVLTDEGGAILKALPKPVQADDAKKAKAATAQWKEFKAALKGQAADQKKRFEQAMLGRREWDGATFKEVIAVHPLLSKMVRSLVWGTLKDQALCATFRVDAEGRYVAADGNELSLDNDARVTLPHPWLLGDKVETWLQIFADNKLTQPFPQLARKWFAEGAETEKLIKARDGAKVPLGSLRGLKAKGWEFEEGSAGMIWSVYKSVDGVRASIDVEPGWSISGADYEDFGGDQTVKLDVYGSDPIAYSELVRDFLSLPVVEA